MPRPNDAPANAKTATLASNEGATFPTWTFWGRTTCHVYNTGNVPVTVSFQAGAAQPAYVQIDPGEDHREWGFWAGFPVTIFNTADEGVQAFGRSILDRAEPHPARSAVVHLDAGGHQHLALVAAPVPAGGRFVLATPGDRCLVDLHQAGQQGTSRGDHRPAQLGGEQPSRLVRSQSQLSLQLQGGDAVGVGGHQIRRPEPDGELELRGVHHRAGGHRGLPPAGGALPGEGLARQLPALALPAGRTAEAVRPAHPRQILSTRPLIREAALKLDERTGKVGHGGRSHSGVRHLFYAVRPQLSLHFVPPEPEG